MRSLDDPKELTAVLTEELLQLAVYGNNWWYIAPDVLHVSTRRDNGNIKDRDFTAIELNSISSNLHASLTALFVWMKEHEGRDWLPGDQARGTIEYLTGQTHSFKQNPYFMVEGETVDDELILTNIRELDVTVAEEDSPSQVWVSGSRLYVFHTQHMGVAVSFVTSELSGSFALNTDDLNTRYPGWYNSVLAADALGVGGKSLFDVVFTKPEHRPISQTLMEVHFE